MPLKIVIEIGREELLLALRLILYVTLTVLLKLAMS
jgi:hypothetical protein